ncbi:MAG: histidine kinase [Cyclobacteriaceae bacterium]|nr:MAG: histidine kinase [Cyclobacteriaceae bacterium]
MEVLQAEHALEIIIWGTLVMLMLVSFMGVFVLLYQKRVIKEQEQRVAQELRYERQMIQLQLESQEQERKRIGADLHDSLGSLLWGAKVNAQLVQQSAALGSEALESHQELVKILNESIEAVRKIAWELTPEAFHYTGLSGSLKKLCHQMDGKPIQIKLLEHNTQSWNDDRALLVFRIIQELITNTFKHSGASQLMIVLDWHFDKLNIRYTDNGKGLPEKETRKGVGMWNIEQRVKHLKAVFQMRNPTVGSGLDITMEIPLHYDA